MNARLRKECRALVLPWLLAASAAGALPLCHRLDAVGGFASFALCAGLGLISASPFGVEYQYRTLPLALAQPIERWRLWNEKLLAVLLALVTVGLVHGLSWVLLFAGPPPLSAWREVFDSSSGTLLGAAVLLATVCSTAFWTMTARSTLGGLALSVMSQFLTVSLAALALHKLWGDDLAFESPTFAAATAGLGLVYSGTFLLLGWRKFARLELRDAFTGDGIDLPQWCGRSWSRWLVCRPQGALSNLLRKELRLQKPVFLIAAVSTACWMLTLTLHALWPEHGYHHFYGVLLCCHVPLALFLAGCLPLAEEKTLGLAAWQLTWPVRTRSQWLLKFLVGSLTGLALGFVLPVALFALAVITDPGNLVGWGPGGLDWPELMLFAWAIILVSFWAGTLAANAARAALTAIFALAAGGACAALGVWGAARFSSHANAGLETALLTMLMARFQWSPVAIVNFIPFLTELAWVLAGILQVLLLLRESLTIFRRQQPERKTLLRYGVVNAVMIFSCAFWLTDLSPSAYGLYNSRPVNDLETAFRILAASQAPWSGETRRAVTVAELERAAALAPVTKTWLRDAELTYRPNPAAHHGRTRVYRGAMMAFESYEARVRFPRGGDYYLAIEVPVPSQQ